MFATRVHQWHRNALWHRHMHMQRLVFAFIRQLGQDAQNEQEKVDDVQVQLDRGQDIVVDGKLVDLLLITMNRVTIYSKISIFNIGPADRCRTQCIR